MGSSCWARPSAMRPSAVSTLANSPPRPSHTRWAAYSLEDSQVVHMLLRLCASFCRVVHLLRAVPTPYAREAIAEFDSAVQKALQHGMPLGVLFDEQALLQLRLPMALGGAGMRRGALCMGLPGICDARGRGGRLSLLLLILPLDVWLCQGKWSCS